MNVKELQTLVNPCCTTGKAILFLLLSGGDPDAMKLAPYLDLSKISKSKEKQNTPPEILNCFKIGHIFRFNMNTSAALKSGKKTIIDLPCGYETRCFKVANNGQRYYGFDLPIVADEMKELTTKIITEEQKSLISFNAVDATNYTSMRQALKDVKGEICIIVEGLIAYFNESELISFCKAIHKLLSEFGGCCMTADGTGQMSGPIYSMIYKVIYPEKKEMEETLKQNIESFMSKFHSFDNPICANGPEKAKEFLEKQGFIIKEESAAKYIDNIKGVPEDKEEELKKVLSEIKIWTLTIDKKNDINNKEENVKFNLETKLIDEVFNINIEGRLDTLTSPELLKIFKETDNIEGIKVKANKMTFISLAGIRVFEIMLKELKNEDKLEIIEANEEIKQILENNGFKRYLK